MFASKVTICIFSRNSRHNLPGCLSGVLNLDFDQRRISLIIIDDNSSDSSVGYVKEAYPQIKVIQNNREVGLAVMADQGYFLAQKNNSDYIVFLDAEVILEKYWLRRMLDILKDKKVAGASSKILIYPKNKKVHSLGGEIGPIGLSHLKNFDKEDNFYSHGPFQVGFVPKEACIIKMSVIGKVGLYNGKYSEYFVDADFGWRCRLAGYKFMIDPIAVAYIRSENARPQNYYFQREKSRLLMLLINYRIATLILLLPLFIFTEFGLIIEAIATGKFWQKMKAYFWILLHLPAILEDRINVQFRLRKVGDLEILKF